jgi:coenzyme F420 hydrogenase subunit beta
MASGVALSFTCFLCTIARVMAHTIEDSVARGICIGCGACSVATGGAIPLTLNLDGMYSASLEGVAEADVRRGSRVCPFSDDAPNEDALGAPTAAGNQLPTDARLGRHSRIFAGRHRSEDYLLGSSSGGLTSWLLGQLLQRRLVDAVIHVGRASDGRLFQYTISTDPESVRSRRKSQYYPTTLKDVLETARRERQRYALVGVPCFVKAARLLCREDETLGHSIRYFVGLVCGHMKTRFFAESLAWQVGIPPDDLEAVDFRLKRPGHRSSDYDFGALRSGETEYLRRRTQTLVGGNWGHAAFQPEACNFCDDVFAETADVVFGDAWLPRYRREWRGTNVVVTRNLEIDQIFEDGARSGDIELEEISVDEAASSQAGGLRHRRDGLAVRLADDLRAGLSVPTKRVTPKAVPASDGRGALVRHRRTMSRLSSDLFAEARSRNDLGLYLRPMAAAIARYHRLELKKITRRFGGLARRASKALSRLRSESSSA